MQPSERRNWAGPEQIYIDYQNNGWGVPEYDSRSLFEKLMLEAFQSGLSWINVLKKCENFRSAFAGFNPVILVDWGQKDIGLSTFLGGYINNKPIVKTSQMSHRTYPCLTRFQRT